MASVRQFIEFAVNMPAQETTGRADGLLIGEQILFVQIVVGGGVHHVDQIGVLLHGSVGKHRGTGLHRTAGDEDGRDVQTQRGHQHARYDLVAVRDADQGVGAVRVDPDSTVSAMMSRLGRGTACRCGPWRCRRQRPSC